MRRTQAVAGRAIRDDALCRAAARRYPRERQRLKQIPPRLLVPLPAPGAMPQLRSAIWSCKHQAMLIRPAKAEDRSAIWAILEPVVRAGETYTLDRDMSEADALDYW